MPGTPGFDELAVGEKEVTGDRLQGDRGAEDKMFASEILSEAKGRVPPKAHSAHPAYPGSRSQKVIAAVGFGDPSVATA